MVILRLHLQIIPIRLLDVVTRKRNIIEMQKMGIM